MCREKKAEMDESGRKEIKTKPLGPELQTAAQALRDSRLERRLQTALGTETGGG